MTNERVYRPKRDPTKLIATAIYTRGLWTALFLWRALSVRPFKSRAVEWGVGEPALRSELRESRKILITLTIAEALLYLLSLKAYPDLAGYLFVLLVALHWTVLPWFAARRLLLSDEPLSHDSAHAATLVASDEQSPVPDLGYLLREATFSVDTSAADPAEDSAMVAASLYASVEQRFSGLEANGIQTQRVRILAAENAQPVDWSALGAAVSDLAIPAETGSERLLIFGQRPGHDGLAAVEFSARTIDKHLSLELRARWLPPLRNRFARLACLPLQKAWWRAGAVPLILALAIFSVWLFLHLLSGGADPLASLSEGAVLPASMGLAQIAPADETPASDTTVTTTEGEPPTTSGEETAPPPPYDPLATPTEPPSSFGAGEPMRSPAENLWPALGMLALFLPFHFGGIVRLVALVAFLPLFGFLLLVIARALRYLRGCIYAATGTMLNVAAPRSYRIRAATLTLGDEGSLRSGLAYLHVVEQTLLDTIIATLQAHNIDTQSIREESRVMINEGIYMTGGSLQASNLVVGAFAKIFSRRRNKVARGGHVTFASAMRGKKEAA
jgi:predicted secreted protein